MCYVIGCPQGPLPSSGPQALPVLLLRLCLLDKQKHTVESEGWGPNSQHAVPLDQLVVEGLAQGPNDVCRPRDLNS